MSDFVHLHVHSHYSLLDAVPKIDELVKAAKKRGFSALALTDHGNMYGAIEFYETCLKEGIKPIIGVEAYVAPNSRFDKNTNDRYNHLVLLALDYTGYRNLIKLVSLANIEGFYYKPRMDKEILRQYHEGLVASTACLGGEIPHLLQSGNYEGAKKAALEYQDIFGEGNFFLELMDLPANEGQNEVNSQLIQLSKDTGIPVIVTRDVHYLNPEDAEAQDILTCIRDGRTLEEPDRQSMVGIDCSMATGKDIASRFKHIPEALANTVKLANRVDLKLELNKWNFPHVDLPEGKTVDEHLHDLVYERLPKLIEITEEVRKRADYELDVIAKKGYSPYFLVVADYVNYARTHDIMETTRGSGAGSIVAYAMGITTVNPLFFKLPFERFLNPFRPSPPDIDADFADDRRDDMIAYVTEKYGADKVAQIITFGTMAARGSIRDVGRALGYSYSFCDQVSKLIPFGAQGFQMTIAKALNLEPDLKKKYNEDSQVHRLIDLAQKIEGCARHTSIHAAGVVIAPSPLTDFTPIQHEVGGDRITTQYEMHAVEAAGVLKMDFLGIRNLSILGHAVEIVEKTTGQKVDIFKIPWDDKKTYEMLARGETMGVFQLSGSGMTRYLRELKPTTIFDIMAMVALFRPGPMEQIPEYIRRKHHPETIEYLDPRMKDYLDQSLGLIVYQDDVLLTAINLGGYNWEEADKFRKAMGKKIPEEMAKQKEKFFKGCREFGKVPDVKIGRLWELIEPFAAYGFNKCLVGDTEITDYATGRVVEIREICDKKIPFSVISLSDNKKLVGCKVSRVFKNGKKKVWEVKTKSGRRITATANHPFLKFGGWNNLEDLHVGDLVAVPRKIRPLSSMKFDLRKLKVLGYLLSEGNLCHPHGVYFYSSLKLEVDDFCSAVEVFKNSCCKIDGSKSAISVYVGQKDQKKGNELMLWIKELGLFNHRATNKFIPDFVFSLPSGQIAVLVGAMWQGDGCIHSARDGQIYYATSSERLAHQMQNLLLRLDIVSTIHTKKFKYRGGVKTGYTIHISRYDNVKNFADKIGKHLLVNKKKVLEELVRKNKILNGAISNSAARGSKDVVPAEILHLIKSEMERRKVSTVEIADDLNVAKRLFNFDKKRKGYLRETIEKIGKYLHSSELLNYARSDIFWDEIKTIEYKGVEETYDLTVPGKHNFVANDFIVHNSHAASYGMVAYQTAYLKANYPVQYMTAVLIAESGDMDKVPEIIHECEHMGIKVMPPDVNESFKNFAMVGWENGETPHIRFGLSGVKNLGEHIADVIFHERKNNGRYQNFEEFLKRVQDKDLNKKSLESLIKCGALDSFGYDRGLLLSNSENLLSFVHQSDEQKNTQQHSLFANSSIDLSVKLRLDPGPEATEKEKLGWEKELLGLYITAHPFTEFEQVLGSVLVPIKDLAQQPRNAWVVVGGVIDSTKKKITRMGKAMMFVNIQDITGTLELLVFPRTYEITKDVWVEGRMVCVMGKTSEDAEDNKLFVEKAYEVTPENVHALVSQLSGFAKTSPALSQQTINPIRWYEKFFDRLEITVPPALVKSHADDIKSILAKYPGDLFLYLNVGDKKIKTSFKVEASEALLEELKMLLST